MTSRTLFDEARSALLDEGRDLTMDELRDLARAHSTDAATAAEQGQGGRQHQGAHGEHGLQGREPRHRPGGAEGDHDQLVADRAADGEVAEVGVVQECGDPHRERLVHVDLGGGRGRLGARAGGAR